MIVSEIKARLKEINTESNTKWQVSGVKDVLLERLGWAEQPQAYNVFSDTLQAPNVKLDNLLNFERKGPVIKRIPKASRNQVCLALTKVLSDVINNNDIPSWSKLFRFTREILHGKTRAGRKKKNSLATIINRRILSFNEGSSKEEVTPSNNPKSDSTLASQVSEKLNQFDMRGAIRLVCSTDKILSPSPEVLKSLNDKHPAPFEYPAFPDPPDNLEPILVTKPQVEKAIRSFSNGAAGGPDGLTPQHIKDLTSKELGFAGSNLLDKLVDFLNHIAIPGKVPDEICPIFYGANLMALRKIDGGIRPIAIGFTLRRLIGKVLMVNLRNQCADLFHPNQLGVGTPQGTEIAVHAIRRYVENPESTDRVIIKVDFRNAFNTLRRDVMLTKVKKLTPSIFPVVWQSYFNHSHLYFGNDIVLSREGIQQGDPLGPFLFALGIADLTKEMSSEFNCFYLDDGTIGGTQENVLSDYAKIQSAEKELGLAINPSKTELLLVNSVQKDPQEILDSFNLVTPGIKLIDEDALTLLGAPIMPGGIANILSSKQECLELMCSRLEDLDRHEAFFLLKNAFSMPKLNYFLRTAPCYTDSDSIQKFDQTLHSTLQKILNVKLDDNAWDQASLPIRSGGLGIRKASDVALPAFLASAHGAANMVKLVNPNRMEADPIPHLVNGIEDWKNKFPLGSALLPENKSEQSKWDTPLCDIKLQNLIESAPSELETARLKAASSLRASDWLNAYPVSNLALKLSNSNFRIACALRLGAPICLPHPCICGKRTVDQFGRHGLSCDKAAFSRIARHNNANMIVQKALSSADYAAIAEPKGLFNMDSKRPDGMTTFPYKVGKPLAWDFTCVDTVADSYFHKSSLEAGKTADMAEKKKIHKYRHLANDFHFIPIGTETLGTFGPEAIKFLEDLGHKLSLINGEKRSKSFLFQSIGISIQKGNAACILGTKGIYGKLEELSYL